MTPRTAQMLDDMIEEATVDCHDESESVMGLYSMLEENLTMPFRTVVLGVDVDVTGIDLMAGDQISAVCMNGPSKQRIGILDLPLPTPPPTGAEWIDAYRRWAEGG